jgi:hypothetical protein
VTFWDGISNMDLWEFIIAATIPVLVIIIPLFWNEHVKRKWQLSEELWKIKYDKLSNILYKLVEIHLSIDGIRNWKDVTKKDDIVSRYIASMILWTIINMRFFEGTAILPHLKNKETIEPTKGDLEEFSKEIALLCHYKYRDIQLEITHSIAFVRGILIDKKILEIVYDYFKETDQMVYDEINLSEYETKNKLLEQKRKELGDLIQTELEKTRTQKWKF